MGNGLFVQLLIDPRVKGWAPRVHFDRQCPGNDIELFQDFRSISATQFVRGIWLIADARDAKRHFYYLLLLDIASTIHLEMLKEAASVYKYLTTRVGNAIIFL